MKRVRLVLEANKVSEAKQVIVFLSCVGIVTYGLLRNLLAPAEPKGKSLEEIVDTLKVHEPKPLVIAERFHFHRRNQGTNESIADYVAELRSLASSCQFEAYLDEAPRDRFVSGILSEATQRSLLSQEKPTFVTAILTRKEAEKNAKQLQEREEINVRVRKIGQRQKQVLRTPNDSVAQPKSCYRCGKAGHPAGECRHKESVCHSCNKRGHLAKVCHSKN